MSPLRAAMTHARELPPHLRPADPAATAGLVESILLAHTPRPRRAIGAPALEPEAVTALVERLRGLHACGDAGVCAVVIPPDRLGEGIALLQAALDAGGDLDIDVLPAESLAAVAAEDDLVVEDAAPATAGGERSVAGIGIPGSAPAPAVATPS
jgi:hypothetical protein